jgi:hypothetical protein
MSRAAQDRKTTAAASSHDVLLASPVKYRVSIGLRIVAYGGTGGVAWICC